MGNDALEKMRAICLAMPNTDEGAHAGKVAFRVGGKMFATCGDKSGVWEIVLGLEDDQARALLKKDPRFTAYPRASNAVSIRADAITDWDDLAELLRASYALASSAKKPAGRSKAPKKTKARATRSRPA